MSEILVNTIKKADGTGSITVPADSGTLLTSASSIPVANLDSAVGITEADQWRVTTNFTSLGTDVTSNWERNDTDFDKIGTGMTESSGIFTFPSTGIWKVSYNIIGRDNVVLTYGRCRIYFSTDAGSNYTERAEGYGGWGDKSGSTYEGFYAEVILDVTDVSQNRVKFKVDAGATITWEGSGAFQRHGATFIRLGDT